MPFSDFPGYEHLTRVFRRIVGRNAFHSAYLFHGPSGMGKRKLAQAFAMAIFCRELEDDFCGRCSACLRMKSGAYPDYRVIEPDGALIKIDQNREMIAEAVLQPYESQKKIFVLDPAERMRPEAANCLLKVLEEPFSFSIFILITSSPRAILPTIDSRCQKIRFSPMPCETLAKMLGERHSLDPQAAATLARISGGRPALAEEMASGDFLSERDAVLQSLGAIAKGRDLEVFRIANQMRSRDAATKFFHFLIPLLRDAALVKELGGGDQLLNPDRYEQVAQIAQSFTREQLLEAWQDAILCSGNLLQNANAQAQTDRVLLHLCA